MHLVARAKAVLLLPAVLLASAPLYAAQDGARAPMIGLEGPDADACAAIGRLTGLPASDGFIDLKDTSLPVYAGPSSDTEETERMTQGTLVWLCDVEGSWQGIVYPSTDKQEIGDCRVSSPVAEPESYSGPCAYGWVPARNITMVAG
ncbi:hypothetical protein D6851_03115 [Altericroceibacterium spongiae]|uniref:Integron n=1 Tax=Altericroceibacterium spongiae TaxID=2320269 RepID=A0A420ES29_9SPHN|nr:hypothetical protein [Altericroceibacterium spongiae]RKF23469.1 hypothetical protein D6851_03115 [Altericroceibacterium spongiae]